ncbi:MAG: hypothetical protein A2Z20_00760 [Bdellovibrionales bacterium RBG_16_40_8]|nr:MAG: hypothetical protein A2Z20_00760 [Bdellovibrionales bacterium RBG_16_40_8]
MTHLPSSNSNNGRPVVYDYGSPVKFLVDLLEHYKLNGTFSLRQRTAKVGACSQALISQILKGNRQLNRDNLPAIASIFKLTQPENQFIDRKLSAHVHKIYFVDDDVKIKKVRLPKNHLLSDWLHPYVKDLVNLNGFALDSEVLFSMLKGIAPVQKIKKSVEFLVREGFWRVTLSGEVAPEEAAVTTTNEIPNGKIRAFHKKALEIAARGLTTFPIDKRKASTILVSIDREHLDDLKGLVDSFQHQLLDFIERHPNGRDSLMQVTIHLTPIGEKQHE